MLPTCDFPRLKNRSSKPVAAAAVLCPRSNVAFLFERLKAKKKIRLIAFNPDTFLPSEPSFGIILALKN